MSLRHSVPILKVDLLAPSCSRCGRNFKAKRKNCHNCGVQVCEDCGNYKTRLPQFGYQKPVRCCAYCSHFLHVYKMDDVALAKLGIKTLKRYLASYNISTHGMIEKQELIKAIQENRPLPEASEVYFRNNTPDTVEKSTMIQEEIYSTQGSGEGRFWDLDKFFSKLFGNDDAPPRNPRRPEPAPSPTQKPQTAPAPPTRPQSKQPQPQAHPKPTKNDNPAGYSHYTQQQSQSQSQPQPQAQPHHQQQYGYPPMPTPQQGAHPAHPSMPTPNTPPYTPPTGANATFVPGGSPQPKQGYYAYPQEAMPNQDSYSAFHGHSQHQQYPSYAHGTQPNYHTTNGHQQNYQHNYPQQGQQHPFTQFPQGTSYYQQHQQHQQHHQHQQYQQHQQHQQYYQQDQQHYRYQQQHHEQQPQPAPNPSSSSSGNPYAYSYSYKETHDPPQSSQSTPRPTPTPQAVPQPTHPTSKSRPAPTSTSQEPPKPQPTPKPTSRNNTPPQTRPVPPTPETPRRGPRAPQDRNDYSNFGSESEPAVAQSSSRPPPATAHEQPRPATAQDEAPLPQSPPPTASRPRPSNRGPQTEHSTAVLTIEEIISANVEPSTLSIKVIKSLLDTNCVSYVGVVEKSDLVNQLQKLMNSTKAEQERLLIEQEAAKKQSEQSSSNAPPKGTPSGSSAKNGDGSSSTTDDDHLCKVCFEASLNCVMLNCNHMATCMDCGKKIMEGPRVCPICREYVVKLLHIFRA